MRAIRTRMPSPAMIVACAALVVALGGASYAAAVLPKNSVGTAQLQKKAVTASKLRADAVSGAKVKNATLMAADFKAGQLPAGPQGPKGDKGDAGTSGISGYQVVTGPNVSVAPGQFEVAGVNCPAGKQVIGGGGGAEGDAVITVMEPYMNYDWAVVVRNDGGGPASFNAVAYCANLS
jgi:hypothetical protein